MPQPGILSQESENITTTDKYLLRWITIKATPHLDFVESTVEGVRGDVCCEDVGRVCQRQEDIVVVHHHLTEAQLQTSNMDRAS